MRPLLPALAALALGGPLPKMAPRFTSTIGGRCSTNKYLGASPSTREAARLAWRARVLLTAAAKGATKCRFKGGAHWEYEAFHAHRAALSAPRPWRSAGRPTPRRRYSREHRKGCAKCFVAAHAVRLCGMTRRVGEGNYGWVDASGHVATLRRDPHGRRA